MACARQCSLRTKRPARRIGASVKEAMPDALVAYIAASRNYGACAGPQLPLVLLTCDGAADSRAAFRRDWHRSPIWIGPDPDGGAPGPLPADGASGGGQAAGASASRGEVAWRSDERPDGDAAQRAALDGLFAAAGIPARGVRW